MQTIEIKCDQCGADLSDAGAMPSYRLHLHPEPIPNSGNEMYAVMVFPPMDGKSAHFCGIRCLKTWLIEKYSKV